MQGHAGTVPMRGRADALAAGAHIVSVIERTCGGGPSEGGAKDLVGTMCVCVCVCVCAYVIVCDCRYLWLSPQCIKPQVRVCV